MSDFQHIRFCNKQNLNKALVTLKGILNAVSFDGEINSAEIKELYNWIREHESAKDFNPFNEIIPILAGACDKNNLENEVLEGLHWFLDKALEDNHFYDAVTNDLQSLQGILHGILADLTVDEKEIKMLSDWLDSHEHLSGLWPYDEVYSLLISVLQDKKLDEVEADHLKLFFSEFVQLSTNSQINLNRSLGDEKTTYGICSVDPNIEFRDKKFCFTGESIRASRKDFSEIVTSLGGILKKTVTRDTDYLVYGAAGNQCWAYSCHGRKVEQAMALRKEGKNILIIHENDFWDCYEDTKISR